MKTQRVYENLECDYSFSDIEKTIIKQWQDHNTFYKSIRGEKSYIFYDGPPFANGLPHYGHLLTGFIKDTFARYHTMLGAKVERRFGWDCHGLPAEMAAEKELGISGKQQIEEFGIGKFNTYCRSSVLKYTAEWKDYVIRQGRWVDFENDYKTMDLSYMESVIWAFKELHNKGLIYESMRVMPYSWACQTPVSDFETRLDNAYRQKQSKAVTIAVKLVDSPLSIPNTETYCLIWTTTPWTLPSNLAIAVGRDIEYIAIQKDSRIYIVSKDLSSKYINEIGDNVVGSFKGIDIIGLKYHPIYDYFSDNENSFQILHGDFVTTTDGTGLVHIAPGFGEDDFNLCKEHGIQLVCPVDSAGKFTFPVVDYLGKQVFDANDDIIIHLKKIGLWLKTEQYLHNYPHCWRTDTPLIYKAIPSWYVKVTAIRDRMLKNNQMINWIPGHIKDGLFGKWLENARDWSISRNRYWGCPIPVWQSDDPQYPHIEIYGSIKEMEEAFGVTITDLHRPFIDSLTKKNPSDPTGRSMLRRVPEVLDCWFESGSMPYAQLHYPFENKDKFEKNFPADFIVEYVAQTRGWFYTLMVLSTALFDRPPFLNCICHGVILGDGGQKLSKRLKNYADPKDIFQTIGSDALRWYMLSSSVMRGNELVIDKDARGIKDVFRLVIKPILNCYNFFTLYANADKINAKFSMVSQNFLDQFIISKCVEAVLKIKQAMDSYDTLSATEISAAFFEVLTNWYIRRSRERFWRSEFNEDKTAAYDTLYSVLITMCKAIAPLLPMTTEAIFGRLSKDTEYHSIHLDNFPVLDPKLINYDLIKSMDRVREACTAALNLRNDLGIKVRQPLSKVTFIGVSDGNITEDMKKLVLDEINVKSWDNLSENEIQRYVNTSIRLHLPALGKRVPDKIKSIIENSKKGNWTKIDNAIRVSDVDLLPTEFEIIIEPKSEFINTSKALSSQDAIVILDTEITQILKNEGIARDFVRMIQQARKDKNLEVTDKIILSAHSTSREITNALTEWKVYIEEQTLCHLELNNEQNPNMNYDNQNIIGDNDIQFSIGRNEAK